MVWKRWKLPWKQQQALMSHGHSHCRHENAFGCLTLPPACEGGGRKWVRRGWDFKGQVECEDKAGKCDVLTGDSVSDFGARRALCEMPVRVGTRARRSSPAPRTAGVAVPGLSLSLALVLGAAWEPWEKEGRGIKRAA